MSDVKSVCFGISAGPFDQGATPNCAMNAGNTVVEVHIQPNHQYALHRLCRIFVIDRRRRDPQRLRSDLMSICPAKLLPIQLAPGDRLTNLYNL